MWHCWRQGWIKGTSDSRRLSSLSDLSSSDLFSDTIKAKTQVQGYSETGFLINNIFVQGSQLLLPHSSFHWDVLSADCIPPEAMAILDLTAAPLELFILGTGEHLVQMPQAFVELVQKKGISLEVMSTRNAIGTFNALNQEDRRVAAGLLCNVPTSPRLNSYTRSSFSRAQ